VFADIEPEGLTIDPAEVERRVTQSTSAILATHVYGHTCDDTALRAIASRHGLRLVYDAAHAFGCRYIDRATACLGDASVLSFHATKLFHTIEGGAVVTDDDGLAERVRLMRNFGHDGPEAFQGVGINGKLSEVHAAMGLAVLPQVPAIIAARQACACAYDEALAGTAVRKPAPRAGTILNFGYYPVLLPDETALLRVRAALLDIGVIPRRYFYPALHRLPYASSGPLPVVEGVVPRVLCLPLYHDLGVANAQAIARCVRDVLAAAA
jgi:dTDP-4-amino-4,6-dideoxygalactose transaminase